MSKKEYMIYSNELKVLESIIKYIYYITPHFGTVYELIIGPIVEPGNESIIERMSTVRFRPRHHDDDSNRSSLEQ